jgi:Fungal specific transcription factor domain
MGKNSEITWMQRLQQENAQRGDEDGPSASSAKLGSDRATADGFTPVNEVDSAYSVHAMSYHLDDEPVTTFEHVDPYEVPTAETAQILFNTYFTRIHPTFPVVGRLNLTIQFQKFLSGLAQRPPQKWLAIINLIFAIAAKYSHLVQADWKGDERDHIIYFTRARLLSVTSETVFEHPDLQVIQITGLISFYFLCISQINRAWSMAGIAIRWATALGLNMRNDSVKLKDSLKEIRYRVWWALYTLEHRLCSMTGRVNCILDDHCTTPLPVPLDEDKFESEEGSSLLSKEQQKTNRAPFLNSHSPSVISSSSDSRSRSATKASGATESRSPSSITQSTTLDFAKDISANSSLYFLHIVQLTRLTQGVFHKMYNPAAVIGTWSDVQETIRQLNDQLDVWYRHLPPMLDFRRKQRDRDFYEFRLSLGFFYYGARIMVNRPCLCRLDRKIPNQSSKSLDLNHQAATTCVDAARDLLALIPDQPNAVGLMRVGPWWSVLHWLVQATIVLLLEISFRAHHMPEEAEAILDASKKGVRWLHALGADNRSARRAWGLCNTLLHGAAGKIGRDVSDMPERAPGRAPSEDIPGYGQAHSGLQNYSVSAPRSSTMMAGSYAAVSHLDQLMRYDEYFPYDQITVDCMNMPSDAEMEFMNNVYHEGQGHYQQDGGPGGNLHRYN